MLPPARYLSAALALKAFSVTPTSRAWYRHIANKASPRSRRTLDTAYLDRGDWLVRQMRDLGLARRDDLRALELGTGWMHFYSLYLRLFLDCRVTLFDVWDNRQLEAMKVAFAQVADRLSKGAAAPDPVLAAAASRARRVSLSPDFETLYALNKMDYVLDLQGSLDRLPSDAFDVVFSMDVLEHVHADALAEAIRGYHRVLKPGGYSIHQVGVDDHLAHYCRAASRKQYLSYSDFWWKLMFENEVQYFNRVPYEQLLAWFEETGFVTVLAEAAREPASVDAIRVARQYAGQSRESLEATRVFLVHRKPG